jgi:histidine triad (HIT) family protein
MEVGLMDDCVFCKIIKGEIPSKVVYEDENVFAFDDIRPVAPVHTLVVPKKHVSTIMDLKKDNIETVSNVFLAMQEIARIKGVQESGFRIITNYGEDGGQTVMHLHYHLIGGKRLGPKIVHD